MSYPIHTDHEQLKHIMPIRGDGEVNKKGGYTIIPHWMIDDLPGLTGNHRAFLQKIARETWGRQVKEAHISIEEFKKYLALSKNTVLEIRDFLVANNYIELHTTNGGRCSKTTYSILVNGSSSEPLIPNKRVRNGSTIEHFSTKENTETVQSLNSMSSTIEQLNTKNGSTIEHPIIKKEEKNFLKKGCSTENSAPQKQTMQLAAQAATESTSLVPAKPKKPKAEKTEQQQINAQVWVAYRDAYQARYGIEPVRNAMVNKQVSLLVSRIGADAIKVAAWFVNHRNAFYIQKGHTIGVLLADCEKLRTEWATGQQMTAKTAKQLDNTQSNLSAFDEFSRMVDAKYGSHS